jgi:hypothetical protein
MLQKPTFRLARDEVARTTDGTEPRHLSLATVTRPFHRVIMFLNISHVRYSAVGHGIPSYVC